jgi:proteasome lid subunit RPN8/RPN11
MNKKGVPIAMTTNLLKKEPASAPRRPTVLRFSPTAWAKLLFLRDAGDSEIGGFGIAQADDLLFVTDVVLVKQICNWASVEFDDESVADFFEDHVDAGRRPEEFARLWVHTHPGNSAEPSGTDEATFARVFGKADWAVMFILARGGQSYARLRYNVGPGVDVKISVEIDYGPPFAASDREVWQEEYLANVCVPPPEPPKFTGAAKQPNQFEDDEFVENWWRDAWGDYADFDRSTEEADYGHIDDF